MRVIVNQLVALGPRTGIGHYSAELLRCLRQQAGDDRIDAFPEGWARRAREFAGRFRARIEPRQIAGPTKSSAGTALSGVKSRAREYLRQCDRFLAARHLQLVCNRGRYDLYHEPNLIPLPIDRPTIATLHDLSVLVKPEWHPADRVAYYEKYLRRGVRNCVHFLAISESGRQEVIKTLGIPPERVTRTYMGVRPNLGPLPRNEVSAALQRFGLPTQFLLYLGTVEPRKNVLRLLQAYCSLPASLRERWPLLVVGRWGWSSSDVADYYEREAKHRGVRQLGYVAEESLALLYNGARALVFPSYYEGFGMPPIEMMACGGAVLASTADAVAEVVGKKAHLVAPEDTDGWRDAMQRVLTDDDWHRSLCEGVTTWAAQFTWENCAADTLQVYRQVCSNRATTHRAA
jgi:alpha-1,3-rhamnosyl/mannosyltransferase